MYNRSLVLFAVLSSTTLGIISLWATSGTNQPPVSAWIGCDGMAVTRTEVGKIVMTQIAPNTPNCNGPKSTNTWAATSDTVANTLPAVDTVSNTGDVTSSLNMFDDTGTPDATPKKRTILLDLSQTDTVNYRIEMIRQQQIRYANAIRSLRVRSGKSMQLDTNGYLIRNDAVQVTGESTGWTPLRSGELVVTDSRENTIDINTASGTSGYAGTRYLRDATPSDLVKIGQADIAYWTDLVHTNVSHMVNIRTSPWYGSSIITTVSRDIAFYRVATVDNWSEVESVDGTIHGFIRSDFLIVDKAQLIEKQPLLK